VFIVIAAGNTYNAGSGGYAGVSGNWSTVGTECEHTGVDPFPDHRAALRQRAAAAILKGLGQTNGSRSCQHFEWSDAGKPDIGYPRVDANEWRRRITAFMQGTTEPEPTKRKRIPTMWIAYLLDSKWCDVWFNGVIVEGFTNDNGNAFGIGPKLAGYLDQGAGMTSYRNGAEYAPVRDRLEASAK